VGTSVIPILTMEHDTRMVDSGWWWVPEP